MQELIVGKVYYKIFDRTDTSLTHCYKVKNNNDKEVKKNINTVLKNFKSKNLFLMNQVHGNNVICDKDFIFDGTVSGDASVTTKKNLLLGILTADCVPILLSNQDGNVISAAHCGWRSAKANIVKKVAQTMRQKGGNTLLAIIGPSIMQSSYEISDDFYQDFIAESITYKKFFIEATKLKHYMFDLPSFVKLKLNEMDIKVINHIAEDTYTMNDKYPSFRRFCHNGILYTQNILSTIVIK